MAWILPTNCPAVIIAGTDGSAQNTAVGAGAGWDYVGHIPSKNASGVYLGQYAGNYWVLTANHVGPGDFLLGATTYNFVTGSYQQIGTLDLGVFRIATNPGLSNLNLVSTTPTVGSDVTMIGFGRNRDDTGTIWYVDTDVAPWVWSETFFPEADALAGGFKWAVGQTKRWGSNEVEGTTSISYGSYSSMVAIVTDFDNASGQGQGSTGDSGGGLFNTTGDLVGMMITIGNFSGQPASTAVFGNLTYSINIATYRTDILAVVPEPSAMVLAGAAFGMLLIGHLRRRFLVKARHN